MRKDGRGDRDYEIQKAVERVSRIAKQSREWIDVYLPQYKKRSKLERAVTKIEGNLFRITIVELLPGLVFLKNVDVEILGLQLVAGSDRN